MANEEQQRALRTLINFAIREKLALPETIIASIQGNIGGKRRTSSKLKSDIFSNFAGPEMAEYFDEMREAVRECVQDTIERFPAYMMPLIRYCFPDLASPAAVEMSSPDEIFLQNASRDRRTREAVRRSYTGVYDVYRYSAHIGHKPDIKTQPASADSWDAWIVHAAMQVFEHEDGKDFCRFRMCYRPTQDKQFNRVFEVNGIVVPIKNLIYFLGFDIDAGYPTVIVTVLQQVVPIRHFMGLITRYREKISSARVGFSRSKHETWAAAREAAQIVRESEIQSDLEVFGESLLNEVKYNGKAVLTV